MARSFWDTYTAARVSRRRVLQSAGTAAAAGAAVWVVGCGGDDNGASSGSTSTPAAAPTSNLDFGTSSSGAVAGGTFNAASSLDFATFDPHLSVGSSQAFFPRLYNAIINRSPNTNDFEFNDLAESLEQPDDVTYVFKIRPGVKVGPNDLGVPERDLDAGDVVATFDRIVALPQSTAYGFVGQWIASTEASSDGAQVTIKTKQPYGYFFVRIGSIVNLIVPREALTNPDALAQQSAGAGPYVLRSGAYTEGQGATIVRNPNYYRTDDNNSGATLPYIDEYNTKIITDAAAMRTAFASGQIDLYTAQDSGEAESLMSGADYTTVQESTNSFISVALNPRRDPWKDERIRKAMNLAIDRQQYVDRIYGGNAKPNGLVHWSLGDYALPQDELATIQPFDVAEAKALIQAATGGDTIDIDVMYPAETPQLQHSLHLPIWLQQMAAAGFNVKEEPLALGAWLDKYTNLDYAASFSLNQIYEWAEVDMDFQHSEGPARNNIFVVGTGDVDPAIDAAIDEAKGITDPVEQAAKTREVQRQIYEIGATHLPLVTPYQFTLYNARIKNVPKGLGSSALFLNTHWIEA